MTGRFLSTFHGTALFGDASITCQAVDGSFEPELIQKGQTRIDGMDDKIIGLYAAGLSTRDIRAHLEEVYGLKVSGDLVSRVTDAVLAEVSDWQNRALEPVYPIVFLNALRVKIRDAESRQVKNKAVYVALGVTPEGEREVLGLWIAANEGAKFWLSIMNNLRNRGVEDILIAVVDGLKGLVRRCDWRGYGNKHNTGHSSRNLWAQLSQARNMDKW